MNTILQALVNASESLAEPTAAAPSIPTPDEFIGPADCAPVDGVEIKPSHWLELRAWRMPNGSKFVQLIDDTEETWGSYCAMMAKRSITRERVKELTK